MRRGHEYGQYHYPHEGAIQNSVNSRQSRAGVRDTQTSGHSGERRKPEISQRKLGLQGRSLNQAVCQRVTVGSRARSQDARIS